MHFFSLRCVLYRLRIFETDNIEDTLISLLGELKQKEIHVLDIKVDRGTLEQHFMEMTRREAE